MPSLNSSGTDARAPFKTPAQILAETEAQWLFTDEEIKNSPSVQEGMLADQEDALRKKSLNFITGVGIGLKLPQLTLYTAGIFLSRFFMRHSLVRRDGETKPLHHYQIAAVALFLATKTEENCRKTKEIIIACCRVAQKKPELIIDEQSKDYWRWRDTLLLYEDVLLEALCFDLSVESPHKLLLDLIKTLRIEHNKKLRTAAWSFVNDSALTTLGIRYSYTTIACAAVYCAARFCGLNPQTPREDLDLQARASQEADSAVDNMSGSERDAVSSKPPWWETHGTTLRDIKRACNFMADMYADAREGPDGESSIYVGLHSPIDELDDQKSNGRDAGEAGSSAHLHATLKNAQNPPSPGSEAVAAALAVDRGDSTVRSDRDSGNNGERERDQAPRVDVEISKGVKRERDGTPRVQSNHVSRDDSKSTHDQQGKGEDVGSEEGELEE